MKVLILVDMQNDFCPGGALAVPNGDEVIRVANELMRSGTFDAVIATKDWHPANHGSFAANNPGTALFQEIDLDGVPQRMWPVHCVQNTRGAEFHPDLDVSKITRIVEKGTNPRVDSYSGFYDNAKRQETTLTRELMDMAFAREIRPGDIELFVCGLATDYCVAATARDARTLCYRTTLILDGCRAVNLQPSDEVEALRDLTARGVELKSSADVIRPRERELRELQVGAPAIASREQERSVTYA